MNLPKFKYHIDPMSNGVFEKSDRACLCCGKRQGYIYTGPVYADEDLDDSICPWCIKSGEAAAKYDAEFSDSHPLLSRGVSDKITEEVTRRNPGYISWQQECWLSHCNDACEFHGDASSDDLSTVSIETKNEWISEYEGNDELWNTVTEGYSPKSENSFYKFKCRHCDLVLLGWDCA